LAEKSREIWGRWTDIRYPKAKQLGCNSPAASDTSKSRSRASLCDKVKAAVALGALPGAEASP
jgi:hypothetical protein